MLRILVINEVSPQIKNRTSIIFEKIVPILSKKNKIEIFWLSYDYKKNNLSGKLWNDYVNNKVDALSSYSNNTNFNF